jgi:hypothetical protein
LIKPCDWRNIDERTSLFCIDHLARSMFNRTSSSHSLLGWESHTHSWGVKPILFQLRKSITNFSNEWFISSLSYVWVSSKFLFSSYN